MDADPGSPKRPKVRGSHRAESRRVSPDARGGMTVMVGAGVIILSVAMVASALVGTMMASRNACRDHRSGGISGVAVVRGGRPAGSEVGGVVRLAYDAPRGGDRFVDGDDPRTQTHISGHRSKHRSGHFSGPRSPARNCRPVTSCRAGGLSRPISRHTSHGREARSESGIWFNGYWLTGEVETEPRVEEAAPGFWFNGWWISQEPRTDERVERSEKGIWFNGWWLSGRVSGEGSGDDGSKVMTARRSASRSPHASGPMPCRLPSSRVSGVVSAAGVTLSKTLVPRGIVALTMLNTGAEPHSITIVRIGGPGASGEVLGSLPPWPAGDSQTLTLSLPSGTYEVRCDVGGHDGEAVAVLTVT